MLRVLSVVCAHAEARASHFKLPPGWRNPAKGVRKLRTGPGHRPWEDTEVEQFRTHWPPDTPQRVAFELLLNTGQRGGDVIAMVRQQYHAGVISLTQAKTGVRIDVPASKSLRAVIDPWLATHPHMVILTGPKGKGLGVDYFRHMMRAAYSAAALPTSCTTHGLRYTAATVMRELGLDWDDIAAVTGHKTTAMVRKYTAKRRRAARAIARLDEAGV
ncbi:hypothetical protein CCR85_01070 [Rhodothalassium salexigens]|nr:tyrosine-type recombinase/integrase [Rhodothalassium salexigens]MBK5910084.1 hypothetical protein [Rhodothalassium salexigens]MBK5920697.1 hypothetical protein [Rhodothalassium salexigens]